MEAVLADCFFLAEEKGIASNALYITTGCVLPISRFGQISGRFYEEGDNTCLQDILIRSVHEASELPDVMTDVDAMLKASKNTTKKTHVVVMDSIAALFSRPATCVEDLEETTNRVKSLGFALKRMARKYEVAVLVCNSVVTSFDPNNENDFFTSGRVVELAVGKPWEKAVASRVVLAWEMNPLGTSWRRTICQVKGQAANSGKCVFDLHDKGVSGSPRGRFHCE